MVDVLTEQAAQEEFRQLVESSRARALWFMKQDAPADITGPLAQTMLDSIAQKANRVDWVKCRRLKQWLSQHSR